MSTEQRFELLNLPGWTRGESIKMLFHLVGEPFIDHRISISEWKVYKQKMLPPTTYLPLLYHNKRYCVVGAINIGRYLARQFGLYAESTNEQSQIEEILGYVDTLHVSFTPIIKATLLKNIEMRLTFADLAISEVLSKFATLCEPDLLYPYPTLNAHMERIENMPQLANYLKERARTFF